MKTFSRTISPVSVGHFLVATFVGLVSTNAFTAEPVDVVLAALTAEQHAPSERVRLWFDRDGTVDIYLIDRLKSGAGPASVHLVKNPGPTEQELIAVDGIQWLRTSSGWERSPIAQITTLGASTVGLFRNGFTGVVENAPVGTGNLTKRRFSGRISWANGMTQSRGRIALSIDGMGRLSAIRFEGECGSHTCRFHELFDYDATLAINRPQP